ICERVAIILKELETKALEKSNYFTIAISGGSLPLLLKNVNKENFSKWIILLADERCVENDSDDSNAKLIDNELFGSTNIKPFRFIKINSEFLNDTKKVCENYYGQMRETWKELGLPCTGSSLIIDCMGPDGHTCSLFPDHDILRSVEFLDYVENSPKPPPKRITLTLNALKMCENVVFLVTGASKNKVIEDIFKKDQKMKYPAGIVSEINSNSTWLLDIDAASLINYKDNFIK
ncbi:nagb/rpia/CoA transferase-like protein, partial [Rozella allomycis CSF55]